MLLLLLLPRLPLLPLTLNDVTLTGAAGKTLFLHDDYDGLVVLLVAIDGAEVEAVVEVVDGLLVDGVLLAAAAGYDGHRYVAGMQGREAHLCP